MDFTVPNKTVVLALQTVLFLASSYKNSLCLSTDFEKEKFMVVNRQHVKFENTDFEDLGDLPTNGEEISQLRLLKVGDHIATPGHSAKLQYFHHGIYLGLEKGVADFGGDNKSDAKPRVIDLLEFMNGRLFRINYPFAKCLQPEESVSKAEELVHNPSQWKRYHLLSNNCEHFATFCKTGRAASNQVTKRIRDALKRIYQEIKKAVKKSSDSSSFISDYLQNQWASTYMSVCPVEEYHQQFFTSILILPFLL
ncbi:hypothetical protein DPMN_043311 [Dreissena polymorpha]|uniref:LRAT domain-containing protein n=1 Tax=Dreissena polymorpha TaxID=45954 RepID=A0A9D4D095_DREPO|nr:hypothetical protein DPMN_043311 [Dreissena polymorpha]